jgi:hypothetical protein
MANSLKTTVGYDGSAQVTIEATEATGGINFKIYLSGEGTQLVGDIRGLFLDLAKDTGSTLNSDTTDPFNWYNDYKITDENGKITEVQWGENRVINLGTGANMNGEDPSNSPPTGYTGPNIFDLGIEFGTQGAGTDIIKDTEFFVEGITLADLRNQYFGLRLTSTTDPDEEPGNTEGSLKLIGQFPSGDISGGWEGLSPGYWRNWSPAAPGNQVNDWDRDKLIYADNAYKSFETVFGVGQTSANDWLTNGTTASDVSLLQALQLGGDIKGAPLKKNALARQATAALLNSLEEENDSVNGGVNYQFTSGQVIQWTQAALTADQWDNLKIELKDYAPPGASPSNWNTQQEAIFGLANIFEYNNNLGVLAI